MDDESGLVEHVTANRRYALTVEDERYVIRHAGVDEPLRTFPGTDAGSDAAWDEFRRLTRRARLHSLQWWLFGAVVVGAVVWVVTGTIILIWYGNTTFGFIESTPGWFIWVQLAGDVANRVMLGSLAVLVGWVVVTRARPTSVRDDLTQT